VTIACGRLRRPTAVLAAVGIGAWVTACSALSATTPFGPVGVRGGPIATERPFTCPDGRLCVATGHAVFGTLHEADGCIWLVLEGSDQEVRIVWPNGYTARYEPFAVFDAGGRRVATTGDAIHADGSGPNLGEADDCGRTEWVALVDGFLVNPSAP
jgi:hypothetical protein